jgi:hypothetical protein
MVGLFTSGGHDVGHLDADPGAAIGAGPFDPERPVPLAGLEQILEAARWSPTAHNMQNFEILVVDAKDRLAKLGDISSPASEVFIRENYDQLAFSEEELLRKKVGILGTMFPEAWRAPGAKFEEVARDSGPSFLRDTIKDSPTLPRSRPSCSARSRSGRR